LLHFVKNVPLTLQNSPLQTVGTVKLNLEQMMKQKDKSVTQLTGGIEGLFKKNKVFFKRNERRESWVGNE
jgi:pyruvate/2-oxoglutarate dehydrogenase complex dihydrolipoamide dehydrogenase (E3) component